MQCVFKVIYPPLFERTIGKFPFGTSIARILTPLTTPFQGGPLSRDYPVVTVVRRTPYGVLVMTLRGQEARVG